MKRALTFFVVLFICMSFVKSGYSQSDAEMKAWMDYMTPGEMHKKMAEHAGNWIVTSTFWMTPDSEPTVSTGTAVAEMIYGGRYLVMKHNADMMGMPFEGMSIEGYDNASKQFNSIWLDNFGTGIMYSTGTYDADKNQVVYTGKSMDPMTGYYKDVRQVLYFNGDGSMTLDMYMPFEGKEYKAMSILMKR